MKRQKADVTCPPCFIYLFLKIKNQNQNTNEKARDRQKPPYCTPIYAMSNTAYATRIAAIIAQLYARKTISSAHIAEAFGVNQRTARRDLELLKTLRLIQEADTARHYQLAQDKQEHFSLHELRNFARNAGLGKTLPIGDAHFMRKMTHGQKPDNISIHDQHQQNIHIQPVQHTHAALMAAIHTRSICTFSYKSKTRTAHPYRLICHKNIWYLFATEGGTLKNFSLHRIHLLNVQPHTFQPDPRIQKRAASETTIWLTPAENHQSVSILVKAEIADYFERTEQLPQQEIQEKHPNGDAIYTCTISHPTELLNTVRYWIPHIHILAPAHFATQLHDQLQAYIGTFPSSRYQAKDKQS